MDLISSNKITGPLLTVFWMTVGWTLIALFKFFSGHITITDAKFQCAFAGLDLLLYLKSTLFAGVAVGVVKREIAFSGDVLNTTSRIQSKCNELGVNILLSQFLLDKLNLGPEPFAPKLMGDIELRGKEQSLSLYTV